MTDETGASFKLADIKNMDIVCCEENEEEYVNDANQIIKLPNNHTMMAEFKMDRLSMLSLIYGQKITNNWLKMHGGVMTRRKKRGRK